MPYYTIENFQMGLDLRRAAYTAPAGSLREATNVHITSGGEIEKRRSWIKWQNARTDTKGLAAIGSAVIVFRGNNGNEDSPNPWVPGAIAAPLNGLSFTVQLLNFPGSVKLRGIIDWDIYDGKIYCTAHGDDGETYHFYDGEHVFNGQGQYVRTFKNKVYAVGGKNLYFSAEGDPTKWYGDPGATGAGFVNLSSQDAESDALTGLEIYYDQLAIFSRSTCQIWGVDSDPNQNAVLQVLRYTGLLSPAAVRQYGNGDVLFLSDNGVRSLKARDSSNAAAVSDVGSPIDPLIRDLLIQNGLAWAEQAHALIDQLTGRFWLVFPDQIYLLSNFPGPKITAWSKYGCNTVGTIDDCAAAGSELVFRNTAGDIYVHTGLSAPTYSTSCPSTVDVRLPFLSFEKPGTKKRFLGIDVACEGTWEVYVSYNIQNPAAEERVATITGSTYQFGRIPLNGYDTHISLRFHNKSASAASIAAVSIHYELGDAG